MSAGSVASRTVDLNGKTLKMGADGRVPNLVGKKAHGREISVRPLSYGFYIFPEAANRECMTGKQMQAQAAQQQKLQGRHK